MKCHVLTSVRHPMICFVPYCCIQYLHSRRVCVKSFRLIIARFPLTDLFTSNIIIGPQGVHPFNMVRGAILLENQPTNRAHLQMPDILTGNVT